MSHPINPIKHGVDLEVSLDRLSQGSVKLNGMEIPVTKLCIDNEVGCLRKATITFFVANCEYKEPEPRQ